MAKTELKKFRVFSVFRGKAFSLVELMIVVAILGILAAIALPQLSNHSQKAKESAAKENLRILRDVVQRYALKHNGVAPGYSGNDPTKSPSWTTFVIQVQRNEHYITQVPANPFNGSVVPQMIINSGTFPPQPDGQTGWIYQPSTKTVKLNWPGKDSTGTPYYDY